MRCWLSITSHFKFYPLWYQTWERPPGCMIARSRNQPIRSRLNQWVSWSIHHTLGGHSHVWRHWRVDHVERANRHPTWWWNRGTSKKHQLLQQQINIEIVIVKTMYTVLHVYLCNTIYVYYIYIKCIWYMHIMSYILHNT